MVNHIIMGADTGGLWLRRERIMALEGRRLWIKRL